MDKGHNWVCHHRVLALRLAFNSMMGGLWGTGPRQAGALAPTVKVMLALKAKQFPPGLPLRFGAPPAPGGVLLVLGAKRQDESQPGCHSLDHVPVPDFSGKWLG